MQGSSPPLLNAHCQASTINTPVKEAGAGTLRLLGGRVHPSQFSRHALGYVMMESDACVCLWLDPSAGDRVMNDCAIPGSALLSSAVMPGAM